MKQITLNIPENKFHFFIELMKSLGFVKFEVVEGDSKQEIIENLEQGFSDLKKYKEGKLKTTSAKEFLNEI